MYIIPYISIWNQKIVLNEWKRISWIFPWGPIHYCSNKYISTQNSCHYFKSKSQTIVQVPPPSFFLESHTFFVIRLTSIPDLVLASNFTSASPTVRFYHKILSGAKGTATMESSRLTFLLCCRLWSTTQYMTIYQGLTCQGPPSVPTTRKDGSPQSRRKDLPLLNGSWIVLQDN